MVIPQPMKSLLPFGCSPFHDLTYACHKFIAHYHRMPTHWAYSKLILPCWTHACHLNTVNFYLSGASPAICYKLFSKYQKFKKNCIAVQVSFIFHTTIFYWIFPPIGLTKTIVTPLLFGSESYSMQPYFTVFFLQ